jgi:hypothetical protein
MGLCYLLSWNNKILKKQCNTAQIHSATPSLDKARDVNETAEKVKFNKRGLFFILEAQRSKSLSFILNSVKL